MTFFSLLILSQKFKFSHLVLSVCNPIRLDFKYTTLHSSLQYILSYPPLIKFASDNLQFLSESETSSDDDECKGGGHHFVRNLVTKWQRVCAGSIRDSG